MKTRVIPSVVPVYIAAAVWPVCGLFLRPHTLFGLVALIALSGAAFVIGRRFFPGETVEVEEPLRTGDQTVDALLAESRKSLQDLRASNAALTSPEISRELDRMDRAGNAILKAVSEKPERAPQVRRFMQYYLPTAAKLLGQYRALDGVGVKGENIGKAMKSVENSLDLIAVAFEKQLDMLYRDEAMDMSTDVTVLETMMKGDGLTDEGIKQVLKEEGHNG